MYFVCNLMDIYNGLFENSYNNIVKHIHGTIKQHSNHVFKNLWNKKRCKKKNMRNRFLTSKFTVTVRGVKKALILLRSYYTYMLLQRQNY